MSDQIHPWPVECPRCGSRYVLGVTDERPYDIVCPWCEWRGTATPDFSAKRPTTTYQEATDDQE